MDAENAPNPPDPVPGAAPLKAANCAAAAGAAAGAAEVKAANVVGALDAGAAAAAKVPKSSSSAATFVDEAGPEVAALKASKLAAALVVGAAAGGKAAKPPELNALKPVSLSADVFDAGAAEAAGPGSSNSRNAE